MCLTALWWRAAVQTHAPPPSSGVLSPCILFVFLSLRLAERLNFSSSGICLTEFQSTNFSAGSSSINKDRGGQTGQICLRLMMSNTQHLYKCVLCKRTHQAVGRNACWWSDSTSTLHPVTLLTLFSQMQPNTESAPHPLTVP